MVFLRSRIMDTIVFPSLPIASTFETKPRAKQPYCCPIKPLDRGETAKGQQQKTLENDRYVRRRDRQTATRTCRTPPSPCPDGVRSSSERYVPREPHLRPHPALASALCGGLRPPGLAERRGEGMRCDFVAYRARFRLGGITKHCW